MRKLLLVGFLALGVYLVYRSRKPVGERDRWGRRLMNERIAPALMKRGAANGSHNGIGILEHTGRVSGTVRQTLVHPIRLDNRVAVPLPYQEEGQWTKNVIASGGCRLQFRDELLTLCDPRFEDADDIDGLPAFDRMIGKAFGGRFLVLDVTSAEPGRLPSSAVPSEAAAAI